MLYWVLLKRGNSASETLDIQATLNLSPSPRRDIYTRRHYDFMSDVYAK